MKAVVWTGYGTPDVLELREVAKPTPRDNELLIRIHAATVTAGDAEVRSMKFSSLIALPMRAYMGIRKPTRVTILGQELAGEVTEVGKDVTRYKPGDRIVASTAFHLGAYAEYTTVPESYPIALLPDALSYEEAATIPTGGMNALHFVRKAALQPSNHILINGAGGSIGTYAVQMAKSQGAIVTAVDSADKLEMLLALGADYVLDYARQDFTESGRTYDAIIDIVGKTDFSRSLGSLNPGGRYVLGIASLTGGVRGAIASRTSGKQVTSETADYKVEDMRALAEQLAAGKIQAVIDRRYPLKQTAEAHRYVDSGRKAGNVIITVVG